MQSVGEGKSESEPFSKWRVGVHTSIAGTLAQAAVRAHRIGCTAFQIFSSSPRMWRSRPISAEEVSSLARLRSQHDLGPLVIHSNYLINMASPNPTLRERSVDAFTDEIRRAEELSAEYLVLHPGSCCDGPREASIRALAASIRTAAGRAPVKKTTILVENMCGQGNVLAGTFAELADILALLDGLPVACCLDTAHCYAAGMDIATAEGLTKLLVSLDETVGLRRVPLIHTNDSRSPLGSRRDRHEHIGRGGIGLEGFRRIVNHPALREKTFILETPIEAEGDDMRNMEAIRSVREDVIHHTRSVAARKKTSGRATAAIPPSRIQSHAPAMRNARP
jgi:deoxyribonuclease-4